MKQVLVGATADSKGRLVAASCVVPSDGESHRCHNQIHTFDGRTGTVVADWVGWQVTGVAAVADVVVCSSVKRHVYCYRDGNLDTLTHPEPERALHCCVSTPSGLYLGGSAGYYLRSHADTLELEAHNLRELDVAKPGRDILAVEPFGQSLLFCGSGRLVVRVEAGSGSLVVSPGPTASTPHFFDAAVVGDSVFLASWQQLWTLADGSLQPLEVEKHIPDTVSAISTLNDSLLVGGQDIVSLRSNEDPRFLYRHADPEARVVSFVHSPGLLPLAVYSDGNVVEVGHSARWLGNALGSDDGV